jgi:hypothetical protein
MRNQYGNLAAGPRGYIWDAAARKNVSYRSYGEFSIPGAEIRLDEEWKPPFNGSVPGLKEHVHPTYPPYNLSLPDNKRIDVWLRNSTSSRRAATAEPQHSGSEHHTAGTRPVSRLRGR